MNHFGLERLRRKVCAASHLLFESLTSLCGYAPTRPATQNLYWTSVLGKKIPEVSTCTWWDFPCHDLISKTHLGSRSLSKQQKSALSSQLMSYCTSFASLQRCACVFAPTIIFIYVFYRNKTAMKLWCGWSKSAWTHCTVLSEGKSQTIQRNHPSHSVTTLLWEKDWSHSADCGVGASSYQCGSWGE